MDTSGYARYPGSFAKGTTQEQKNAQNLLSAFRGYAQVPTKPNPIPSLQQPVVTTSAQHQESMDGKAWRWQRGQASMQSDSGSTIPPSRTGVTTQMTQRLKIQ